MLDPSLMRAFDREVLARTVDGEARNQTDTAQRGVMWAVWNRFNAGKWYSGKTIAECCLMQWQFSEWNWNDPGRRYVINVDTTDPIFYKLYGYTLSFANTADPTYGATHFYSTNIAAPNWTAAPAVLTASLDAFRFYKGVA